LLIPCCRLVDRLVEKNRPAARRASDLEHGARSRQARALWSGVLSAVETPRVDREKNRFRVYRMWTQPTLFGSAVSTW